VTTPAPQESRRPVGGAARPGGGDRTAGRGFSFSLREIVRETVADLRQNKLRAFLTMLGIAWGVASLIILTAIGEGMSRGMRDKNELLGKNIIIVWGGMTSLPGPGIRPGKPVRLTVEDYEAVRREAYWVVRCSPELDRGDLTSVSDLNRGNFDVHGVLADYMLMRSMRVAKGRLLAEHDMRTAARVCLIGEEVDRQMFNGRAQPGDRLAIGGLDYRVAGVLLRQDQHNNYSGPDNRKIFVPFPAMRRDFPYGDSPLGDRHIADIIAQPAAVETAEAAEVQIRQVIGKRKLFDPLDEDALPIWNTATQNRLINQIFVSMQIFLGFVAVVTLLLGGIGVMNIMLVTVRSRTREIGLRKAVGATARDILGMFFLQALTIALFSGSVGYVGALTLCYLINQLPLPDFFAGMLVTPWMGGAAFAFLLFVALAAAYYPSQTAAALDPVEALRFEE